MSGLPAWAADDIEELEDQTSALESELEGINQDILSLSEDISSTEMQVEILNGEILRTSDALEEAENNEEKQYEAMKIRIKYMYEHGNASLLELLFSAEDMADFLNKADFIESLSEYDRDALDQLQDVHQEIADQKSVLEEQQASLTELQASLKTQQEELQKKRTRHPLIWKKSMRNWRKLGKKKPRGSQLRKPRQKKPQQKPLRRPALPAEAGTAEAEVIIIPL